MKKVFLRMSLVIIFVLCTLLTTACNAGAKKSSIPLTEIILGGNAYQIVEKQTVDFTITYNPINTTDKLGEAKYTITGNAPISDGDYTIDKNKITFLKSNLYTVSCLVNGIKSNDFKVRVTPYYEVDWINMADSSTTIAYIGEKCAITAFIYGVAFDPSDPLYLPDNPGLRPFATNQNFNLKLLPTSTADGTFNVKNDKHFFVPTMSGKADIELSSESNPAVTAMIYIDVVDSHEDILPEKLDLVTLNDEITVGESTILTASVLPRNAFINLNCVRDASSTADFTIEKNNEGADEKRNLYAYKITAKREGNAVIKVYSEENPTVNKKITINILPSLNAESDFAYEEISGGIKITGLKKVITETLNIPVYINGLPVIEIGAELMKGNTSLQSLVLPFFCKTLGTEAFSGCTSLERIVFPYHLSVIGTDCFKGDTKLAQVKLFNAVSEIGDGAFENCSKLSDMAISKNVAKIGARAFKNTKLTTLDLPYTLKIVGANAFEGITTVKRLYIPECVTAIGANALGGWTANQVVDLEIPTKPEGWDIAWAGTSGVTPNFAVDNFSWVVHGDSVAITGYFGRKSTLTIPVSLAGKAVIGIEGKAFSNNKVIKNIEFAENCAITYIGEYAFRASSLEKITDIPATVTTIGGSNVEINKQNGNTFLESSLHNITFQKGTAELTIFDGAFASCYSLKAIVLPTRLKTFHNFGFSNAIKLESVTFEDNASTLDKLADWTFGECKALKTFVIPASVNHIGNNAFFNCMGLEELNIPSTVTKTGFNIFSGMKGRIILPFTEGNAPKGWYTETIDGQFTTWAGGSEAATLVYSK